MSRLEDDVPHTIRELWNRLLRSVNFISFGDGTFSENLDGQWITFIAPSVANVEFALSHDLRRVPAGYLLMGKDRPGDLYDGTTDWTTSQIFLRCSASNLVGTIFLV